MEIAFGMGDPAEHQRQMEAAEARAHEMKVRVYSFLQNLPADDLVTVRDIIALSVGDNGAFAHHAMGICHTLLVVVHKRCQGCGLDHDNDILGGEKVALEQERQSNYEDAAAKLANEVAAQQAVMDEYGITRRLDGQLACSTCGVIIQSVEDRMLRRPGVEGCSSCQQKAKWG